MSKRRGPDPLRGTPAIIGGLVAAVLVAIAPTFASACSPISYENSGSPRPLETNIAAALYRQAATVDLVVAESVTPVPLSEEVEDILRRQAFNGMPPSVGVTFRVLERLKGRSEDSFRLDALTPTSPDRLEDRRRWAAGRGAFRRPRDYWGIAFAHLNADDLGFGCHGLPVAVLGANYVIFRDADGQLLEGAIAFQWRHSGVRFEIQGPVFEEVFDDDPWLNAVRRQASRSRPD